MKEEAKQWLKGYRKKQCSLHKNPTKWLTEVLHDALMKKAIKSTTEYEGVLDSTIKAGLYLSRKEWQKALDHADDLMKHKQ